MFFATPLISLASLSWKAWKFVIDDARVLEAALEVGGDQVAQVVVVLGVLGQQHAEPVADGDARA